MSNILRGRVYEVNSSNQFLNSKAGAASVSGGQPLKVNGVLLVMTATTAVLQLGMGDSLGANVILQLDKYTPFIDLGGVWLDDVMVTTITNGTGYLYLA